MDFRSALGGKVLVEGVEMFGQWCSAVVGGGSLGIGQHAGAHQLRPAFEDGKHLAGSLFVPATRRDNPDDVSPVPILGEVGPRFDQNARLALLARRHQRLAAFPLRVFPGCKLLPFASDNPGRQRFRERLFEHGSHGSPTLSLRSQLQGEVSGELIGYVEAELLAAGYETHDAWSLDASFTFQRLVIRPPSLDSFADGSAE
jgi:hypothetical protein